MDNPKQLTLPYVPLTPPRGAVQTLAELDHAVRKAHAVAYDGEVSVDLSRRLVRELRAALQILVGQEGA